VSWRTCRGPIKGGFHGFAIEGDQRPLHELRHGLRPGEETGLKALRIEAGKNTAKGVMGGNAVGQSKEGLEPRALALTKELHILDAFPARQERAQGNDQDIKQEMLLRPLNAGGLSGVEMLDNRCVHGVSHGACSSAQSFCGKQHSIGCATRT